MTDSLTVEEQIAQVQKAIADADLSLDQLEIYESSLLRSCDGIDRIWRDLETKAFFTAAGAIALITGVLAVNGLKQWDRSDPDFYRSLVPFIPSLSVVAGILSACAAGISIRITDFRDSPFIPFVQSQLVDNEPALRIRRDIANLRAGDILHNTNRQDEKAKWILRSQWFLFAQLLLIMLGIIATALAN